MNVLILTGSPHKNGTSAYLAEQFARGAEEAGHQVSRFEAAFKNVHPCLGCDACKKKGEGCVFKDDMEQLNPLLAAADVIAFVSPIYYYGINAQLKMVIDRFYAQNDRLKGADKRAVLLLTCEDETDESVEGAIVSYRGMISYLEWKDTGVIAAKACGVLDDVVHSPYPAEARELGMRL